MSADDGYVWPRVVIASSAPIDDDLLVGLGFARPGRMVTQDKHREDDPRPHASKESDDMTHPAATGLNTRLESIAAERERLRDRKTRELNAELERLDREAARIARRIELHNSYGSEDTWPDGTLFTFVKRFGENGSASAPVVRNARNGEYAYAALRAGGLWYLTGSQHRDSLTWDELVMFLTSSPVVEPDEVWVVESYATLASQL